MKRLQRRGKSTTANPESSTATTVLSQRLSAYQNILYSRWQALSPRDQLALAVLSLFLLLFVGGYGGYSMHQAVNKSKDDYHAQVADYFWLRAQAGNIDSNAMNAGNTTDGSASLSPATSVNELLTNSGIVNAQVVATGETIQLSFNNASQAVVSAALGKLEQQGWQFTQLSIQQDLMDKSIQVQATIAS